MMIIFFLECRQNIGILFSDNKVSIDSIFSQRIVFEMDAKKIKLEIKEEPVESVEENGTSNIIPGDMAFKQVMKEEIKQEDSDWGQAFGVKAEDDEDSGDEGSHWRDHEGFDWKTYLTGVKVESEKEDNVEESEDEGKTSMNDSLAFELLRAKCSCQ